MFSNTASLYPLPSTNSLFDVARLALQPIGGRSFGSSSSSHFALNSQFTQRSAMDACQTQGQHGDGTPAVAQSPAQQKNLKTAPDVEDMQGYVHFQRVLDECLPPPSTRDWYADP